MPQQITSNVENNFTGGLKTEYTGLNFPENACTDTDNCVFSIIGETYRRSGMDFEENFSTTSSNNLDTANKAINTYRWNNVGGDGNTKILVVQIGTFLYFYRSTDATLTSPLSTTRLSSTVDMSPFAVPTTSGADVIECQFTDGNGYLFVFHPQQEPFYCSYNAGTVTAHKITVQIRDFSGLPETVGVQFRPGALNAVHNYNLLNQGWQSPATWTANSNTLLQVNTGSHVFTVAAGLGAVPGEFVNINGPDTSGFPVTMIGPVTAYSGTSLTINVTATSPVSGAIFGTNWSLFPNDPNRINAWNSAQGNYPSNADVWWRFRNSSGAFDPSTTAANIPLGTGAAPNGFFVTNAFQLQRTSVSGVSGLTDVITTKRPRTGAWFQGRVWYSGVEASQAASGNAGFFTWTENIYFSQIITDSTDFGSCYQVNDPTDPDFFDLLPSDGGVITIQGCGGIYKLFPIQNGMLVFAANGIWFITGSQGIGFTANDYTVTKISSVQSMSATSFVDVLGFPVFWNLEGVYHVTPSQQGGGLVVNNLCIGTILTFYGNIPLKSKQYVRGDFNPLTYVVSWLYRDSLETGIGDRYYFNRSLNFNTVNKAFYPYSIEGPPYLLDVKFIENPGGSPTSAVPTFKYLTTYSTVSNIKVTFSEERDEDNWLDFISYDNVGTNYTSYFITGYKLHGQGITKFQPIYLQMFSKGTSVTAYKIQGIWDYANSPNSGRYSNIQLINNSLPLYGVVYKKHKIRGRGLALQLKVISVDGKPFDFIGWSSLEAKNTSM